MEATSMAYVVVMIAGISLQSNKPIEMDACTAFQLAQPQAMCIAVEPDCGKGSDNKCLGRADLEEHPAVKHSPTRKRRTATRRRSHYSSSPSGGRLVPATY